MKSYQALGALLLYPGADVLAALDDIRSVLEHEDVVPRSALPGVRDCIAGLATADPWTACEAYVATFDRGRATALNLFEHVHGESRDRGQALVDLGAMYADAGLNFDARELPDYLPAYLEFVATQPADVARDLVAEIGHILHKLGEALAERGSPYAYRRTPRRQARLDACCFKWRPRVRGGGRRMAGSARHFRWLRQLCTG
ncbi:MAG TPA: nitrate reductase molybdenum cofactor assembly chaperone [Rhodocyclaceae bacterium]|nr:nitrate reductase molybdenum cofactor assembly chaperone [Rhodocyclaceae bacterium]